MRERLPALGQDGRNVDGDRRVRGDHVLEAVLVDREDIDVGGRSDRGGAPGAGEQGHLAEELALHQSRQGSRHLAEVLAHLHLAAVDHEETVSWRALLDDVLASSVMELSEAARRQAQLLVGERTEQVDGPERALEAALVALLDGGPRLRLVQVDVANRERDLDAVAPEVVPDEPEHLAFDGAIVLVAAKVVADLVVDGVVAVADDAENWTRLLEDLGHLLQEVLQHREHLVRRRVEVHPHVQDPRMRLARLREVDQRASRDLGVGDDEGVSVPGSQLRGAPGDLLDAALMVADPDPVPEPEGRVGVEGNAAEEVAESVLEREADHRAHDGRPREERGGLEAEAVVRHCAAADRVEQHGDDALEERRRRLPLAAAEQHVEEEDCAPDDQGEQRQQQQQQQDSGLRSVDCGEHRQRAPHETREGEGAEQWPQPRAQPRQTRECQDRDDGAGARDPGILQGVPHGAPTAALSSRTPRPGSSRKGRIAATPAASARTAPAAEAASIPPMAWTGRPAPRAMDPNASRPSAAPSLPGVGNSGPSTTKSAPSAAARPAPSASWREAPTIMAGKARFTPMTGSPSSGSCTPAAPAARAMSGRPFTSTRAPVPDTAATSSATRPNKSRLSRSFSRTWMKSAPARAASRHSSTSPRVARLRSVTTVMSVMRRGRTSVPGAGALRRWPA